MSNFFVKDIRGVIPAMVTPFDENEALDLARTRALTAKLIEDGAQGLYLTGSTGEGFLCTSDERKAFVETVLDEAAGRIPVIVHVGAISTLASEDLARHAARAGAAAISSVPPIYWKFSDDQIAAYYSDLVQAAGIPMFDIFRIKEALGQDFAVYSGSDELAVSGLAFGADGIIGSTYNVLTPLFLKLNAQMAAGDVIAARETQKIANKLIFALLARGLMPSLKATLTLGGRVDGGISRRPFFQLTEEQHEALKAEYRAIKAAHGDLGLDFLKAL